MDRMRTDITNIVFVFIFVFKYGIEYGYYWFLSDKIAMNIDIIKI